MSRRFTAPTSVVCTVQLDDDSVLQELGLSRLGYDGRGRMILDGPLAGQISVIDTALAMAADHGAEDAYARNAAVWARREAQHLLNAHLAVRDPWGGIKLPDGVE